MNANLRHNSKWLGCLLTLALLVMTSASNASWQCLDGRPCPPGCMMQHGPVSAHPPCCHVGQRQCPFCPSGARLHIPAPRAGCSSTQCVLRISARPDTLVRSKASHIVDAPVALPLAITATRPVETTADVLDIPFIPPRAGGAAHHAPRAPPALL